MKVRIETDWASSEERVFIYEKRDGRLFVVKPVDLVAEEVSDYRPGEYLISKIPPTLRITREIASDLFAAFARELARLGYRDDQKERDLVDILKVTNEHLEDMRKLVFAGKDIQ